MTVSKLNEFEHVKYVNQPMMQKYFLHRFNYKSDVIILQ